MGDKLAWSIDSHDGRGTPEHDGIISQHLVGWGCYHISLEGDGGWRTHTPIMCRDCTTLGVFDTLADAEARCERHHIDSSK